MAIQKSKKQQATAVLKMTEEAKKELVAEHFDRVREVKKARKAGPQ